TVNHLISSHDQSCLNPDQRRGLRPISSASTIVAVIPSDKNLDQFTTKANYRKTRKTELGRMSTSATTVSTVRSRPRGGSTAPVAASTSRPTILVAAGQLIVPWRSQLER